MMLTTPGGRSASWRTSASSSAVSGVVSAGLSTTVLPVASAGAIFQLAMSIGKFHGMTWPATPSGAAAAAGEGVVELVGPARVVEEVRGGERQVDVAGLLDRLAAVERLEDGELPGPLLQQAGDAVQVLGPLLARQVPPTRLVGLAGGGDGEVDVLLPGLGDHGQLLLGGRVDRREVVAGAGLDPLAVDEQPVGVPQRDDRRRLERRGVVEGELAGLGQVGHGRLSRS